MGFLKTYRDFLPASGSTFDVGSSALRFRDAYFTGTVTTGSASASGQYISTVASGVAPISVISPTVCTTLNVDLLDGAHVGTAGANVPLMSTANTWDLAQTFTTSPVINTLTATRVPFAGAGKNLVDDSDMTFATDTLSVTKLLAPTSVSTPSLISTGALGITPAGGNNLNVTLTTTGDFVVNTTHLCVDTSESKVGIGVAAPLSRLHVIGTKTPASSLYPITCADDTAIASGIGGGINFYSKYTGSTYTSAGCIDVAKSNATDNQYGFDMRFYTRENGVALMQERARFISTGQFGLGVYPTANLHIKAGTATASTAPLKFGSGPLLATPEIGAVEYLNDDFYGTITTGAARKKFVLDNGSNLTSGRVPFATTNGRLVDDSDLTFATDTLTSTKVLAPTSVSTPSLISTAAIDIQPAASNSLTVTLGTTGDFKVNTNHLVVDTSATNTGIGTAAPAEKLTVNGTMQYQNASTATVLSGQTTVTVTFPVAFAKAPIVVATPTANVSCWVDTITSTQCNINIGSSAGSGGLIVNYIAMTEE